MMDDWRPGSTVAVLQKRAAMYRSIRQFFYQREVLEVDTPLLCSFGVSDPALENIQALPRFLQTSPEYAMKRLLAAGCGDIFQLCKGFRAQEYGRWHNPEFTILEWYRLGFSLPQLYRETLQLIRHACTGAPEQTLILGYADVLEQFAQLSDWRDAHLLDQALARAGIDVPESLSCEHDAKLDLLMSVCVAPRLPKDVLLVIDGFPASQCALARLGDDGMAQRFEIYWGALELANGFNELTDASEQSQRFAADNRCREKNGQRPMPADVHFLSALSHGLPQSAGVALGVDRLLAAQCQAQSLDQVLAFSWERC